MIAKFRERWDKLKESAKRKREAKAQAERELAGTRKELNSAVDKFDKKVIEGTQETKSWFGSWFK